MEKNTGKIYLKKRNKKRRINERIQKRLFKQYVRKIKIG